MQDQTPWAAYKDLVSNTVTSVQVKDFACPQFEALVKNNTNPQTMYHQMRALFDVLDRQWKDRYARYL